MKNISAATGQERQGFAHSPPAAARSMRSFAQMLGLLALFLALAIVQRTSYAAESDAGREQIVALRVGAGNTLLKATTHALFRNSGGKWERIALPAAAARGIAALAVPAGRTEAMYIAGSGFGVLRSTDGGRTWVARNEGLPNRKVVALTAHATQADTVYAFVVGAGIFRSEDAGVHWKLMDHGPRNRVLGFVHSDMPGSMQTGWLFAATAKGVRRSMDCFCGWQTAGALKGSIHAVSYDPQQPRRVYAVTSKDLFVSTDGGEQWTPIAAPAGTIGALSVGPSGTLYVASGTGIFSSADQGKSWEPVDA